MNSSFYFNGFEKLYKSARKAFPPDDDPQPSTTDRNTSLKKDNSDAAGTFSSLAGLHNLFLPLNTEAA